MADGTRFENEKSERAQEFESPLFLPVNMPTSPSTVDGTRLVSERGNSITGSNPVVGSRACRLCGERTKRKRSVYCSLKCMGIHQRIPLHEIRNPRTVRFYLLRTRGHRCESCRRIKWLKKPIPLEVDHKNGDSTNNTEENLWLLCPNCHAQTDTFKSRNKGNGRFFRRTRYAEGKSY